MFSERKIWNDGAPFEDFMGRDGAPPVARRHLAFGGGKGGSGGTTYQTQQTTIPPEVQARYNAVNQRAEQVAQQPFKPYEGQFVAPMTGTQQAGINQIAAAGQGYQPYQQAATTALTGAAEAALPYYGQAGQNIGAAQAAGAPYTGAATMAGLAGAQAVNPGQLNIGQYMDPYLQSVVAPTMQGLYQQQQQQQSQLMGSQAMRGAFGGDRGSIAAANLARQQGLAAQQAQGGLLSQGYGQALQAAQQQQGVGLGAEQANRAALQQLSPQLLQIGQQAFQQPMAAAQAQQGLGQGLLGYGQNLSQGLTGIGQQGTQTGLASGQALLGAGTLEQQTQQQLNAALYNQYQQQQGYPFQVAQFLANIAMGTGPLYGSTTSGVTGQPTPFFSDERLKEDITEIGRTHDGQKIIKFRYKNEPPGTSHIGLSAQDVEKHHPEAVSETPEGIKAVDYDKATQHAERAYGGGLMPSSEGGAVHPSMAGLGFASGGTPVPGANPEVDEMLRGLAPRPAFAGGGEAEMLQKLFPWGASGSFGRGTPGAGGAWSPGLTVKPQAPLGSGVQLKAPAPRPSGLSQTVDTVKSGLGAVDDGKKLYKSGKEAYNWAKDAVGSIRDKIELPDLTKQAEDYAADPNVNPTVARGGRIGYATDGAVEDDGLPGSSATEDPTPAIPGGGDDTPLGKLTAQQVTPAKLPEHKLDMSSGAGAGQKKDGTGKAIGSLAGAGIGAMFGPAGMGMGSTLGGLLGGLFARGGATDIEHAKGLISRVESGGRYDILGPEVRGQGRAHGKYQVMPANIPSWTEEALGRRMTPAEFLANPEAQERVFEHHFGKSLKQYGNLADAASVWHSGVPLSEARRQGRRDVNMSTEDYVAKIIGGGAPAEAHMRPSETAPPQRSAGLAPSLTKAEDTHERLPLIDTGDDFEMPERFEMPDRFAAGGLVPRHGYQAGGGPSADDLVLGLSEADLQSRSDLSPGPLPPRPAARATPAPAATGVVTPPAAPAAQNSVTTTPLPPPKDPATPSPKDRDFLDRAGDWYDRNQNWVLPAVSGIGKMLASPSPYLGVAIGQGLAEAAPNAMAANFKQQGLDINMMDRVGKQIGMMASDVALRGGPGMSPDMDKALQAAMTRYYRLSGVDYTPTLVDPAKAREQLASSPFAKLRFADNPDLLYRASQTPGLAPEQKAQFLAQASEATKRLADQGYGLDDAGVPIPFANLNELLRNSLYGKAVASTSGSTAGAGAPGGSEFRANIQANLSVAQTEYQRTLAQHNNNAQHPEVLAAQARVQELQRDLQKGLSPTVGRAYGGRAGYALDGAVEDMTEAQPVEDIQLAQATPAPAVPTMPTMPKPPSQAPAPAPRAPIQPSPQNMPGGNPQTAQDYLDLYGKTLGLVPPATSEMYQRKALELNQMAVGQGKQPGANGVEVAPGAVNATNAINNSNYNTKFMQEESQRQQERNSVQTGLDVLTDALTHVNTNPLAPFTAKVSEYARSFGFNVGTASERAAAVQEIAKQVAQQSQLAGTDLARNMSQEGSVEAIKNPKANRAIMAQAYAKLDHDRARYDYFLKELDKDRSTDPAVLQQRFERENPREKMYEQRFNELALPGSTPLTESGQFDWNALKTGARYYLSPDEWWRMSGGEKITQPRYVRVIMRDGKRHVVTE
jgi:hypothetical protein